MDHIIRYGLTVVGMAVLALICGGLSGRFGAKASTGFARNLRREMYRNVQKFSFANIDKFSTSGIITRLTTDVTNVHDGLYDDHPHRGPVPHHADLRLGAHPAHQPPAGADLPGDHPHPGRGPGAHHDQGPPHF